MTRMHAAPTPPEQSIKVAASPGTRFALRFLILFSLGCAAVLILEVAEKQNAISKLGESVSRLVICSILLGTLAISARRHKKSIRIAVSLCILFVMAELCFEVLEDLRIVTAVFSGVWKHGVEKAIVACWTCSGFYLIYSLVNELDKSNDALQTRESEMREANRELAQALNGLKRAQERTIEHERLNALGQMASGVAHDLNNALTPVESLSRALMEESIRFDHETIKLIHLGAEHSMEVVKKLQHFYRPDESQRHDEVALAEVVQRTVDLTRFRWSDSEIKRGVKIEIKTDLAANCAILGNSTELIQLLTNLVLNAIEAMNEGGVIQISVKKVDRRVVLSVADQGCGMSQSEIKQCFEPFYSQKDHGSGLGLSVCHGIARRHRANIDIDSTDQVGCRFTVCFPAIEQAIHRTKNVAAEPIPLKGKKILCIDDNEWVRRGTQLLFEPTGADIHVASDGHSGLELLKTNDYDLLVTDFGMKEMSGREVVARAKTHDPRLPVAVVSGWYRDQVLGEFSDGPKPDFVLEKPLNVRAVQNCLASLSG